jgi:hypothetical protein
LQTQPSLIKRKRRTAAEIATIEEAMYQILAEVHPRTGRNVFYVLSGKHLIEKTENEYNNTVIRLLTRLRKQRRLPFAWLADATRWMRKPHTYTGIANALETFAKAYRRDVWDDAEEHVEIWTEKDAIASIMFAETSVYDVPLLAGRGYASHSFLYTTAEYIREIGKPAYIYYFGDYDPRGVDISRFVEECLREYAEDIEITFERVALTREQIDRWHLPTRPTKREKSGFGKNFDPDSVDIDTMDPRDLRALVKQCIEYHLAPNQIETLNVAEREEQNFLRWLAVKSPVLRVEARQALAGKTQDGTAGELMETLRVTMNAYLSGHTNLSWEEIVSALDHLLWIGRRSQEQAEGTQDRS